MTARTGQAAEPRETDDGYVGPMGMAGRIIPVGVALLTLGMILVVAGVVVAPLFRPGTWIILAALLVIAAGGLLRLAAPANG